jgi:phage terminase large subunit
MAGIDMLKRYRLNVTKSSVNLIKELRNYKFVEDYNGKVLNKPVDAYNHAIDAVRYATYNRMSRPNYGRYAVR